MKKSNHDDQVMRNHLDAVQKFKLNKWMETNRTELSSLKSDEDISSRATPILGFTVTDGNIKGARKALGWRKHAPHGTGRKAMASYVDRPTFLKLAGVVARLHARLGEPVPPELESLIKPVQKELDIVVPAHG
jgi:hypothetical protein